MGHNNHLPNQDLLSLLKNVRVRVHERKHALKCILKFKIIFININIFLFRICLTTFKQTIIDIHLFII